MSEGDLIRSFVRSLFVFVPSFVVRRSFLPSFCFLPSFFLSSPSCVLASFLLRSCIPSPIPFFISWFVHSFVRSFIRSFVRWFIRAVLRSFIHSFVHPFVLSFVIMHRYHPLVDCWWQHRTRANTWFWKFVVNTCCWRCPWPWETRREDHSFSHCRCMTAR
mgnify:CR=1 FL=1